MKVLRLSLSLADRLPWIINQLYVDPNDWKINFKSMEHEYLTLDSKHFDLVSREINKGIKTRKLRDEHVSSISQRTATRKILAPAKQECGSSYLRANPLHTPLPHTRFQPYKVSLDSPYD